MTRARDPLTAASSQILVPVLKVQGFRRKSGRNFIRVPDTILQLVYLQKSAWGGSDFCVNYSAMSLFYPRDFIVLEPGARLRHENGAERWWPAGTHEQADGSMAEVVSQLATQAGPFFEATSTTSGLLDVLLRQTSGSQHHLEFERAVCLVRLNRVTEALTRLEHACALYREDGRDWCGQYIEKAERLIDGCRDGTAADILRGWIVESVRRLRLDNGILPVDAG